MQLDLSQDQALVLFDWLSRFDDAGGLARSDAAEQQVLWSMQAQLEKALTEPFRPDYQHLVEAARRRIADA